MSTLFEAGAATQQPTGTPRVNPAWAGRLVSLVHFADGATPYDVVDKRYYVHSGSSLRAAPGGRGLTAPAVGASNRADAAGALATTSGEFTLVVYMPEMPAATDTYGAIPWSIPADNTWNQISADGTGIYAMGNAAPTAFGEDIRGTKRRTLIFRNAGSDKAIFLDRKKISWVGGNTLAAGAKSISIGGLGAGVGYSFAGVIASVAVIRGAITDAEALAWVNNPWLGYASVDDSLAFLPSALPDATGTTTITEIAQVFGRPRVFEGAAGSATVALSGTQAGSVDDVQVQIEFAAGGVVVPWTTIDTAVADGGAWSGSLSVPRGGWYVAKARRAGDIGAVDTQAQQWGVGYVVGMFGQSHLVGFASGGTGTPDARAGGMAVWDGGASWTNPTTAGAGRNTFVSSVVTDADCPVACIIHAVGGTSLGQWWQGAKTASWTDWESKVTEAGGELSAFVLWQGEGNLSYDTKSSYMTKANEIFTQLRTDYGANLPVTIGMLGRHTGGLSTDPDYSAIRDAHVALSKQTDCNGFPTYDQDLADGTHFNLSGPNAERMAQCVAAHYGDVAYSSGPIILSVTRVAPTQIDVNIQHFGGTDFTPTTGITGFSVLDSGSPITITGAVRQAANKIRLTLASTPTGVVTVRYGYGQAPNITGAPHDNSGLTLPLITTDADLTAAGRKVLLNCIQRVGGAAAASVTGLRWAFFDQSTPDALTAPVVTGTGESTDGSGVLEIDVIGTSLEIGATGYLVTDTADGVGFAGPVVVSG